ncbi:unnamed protein product, partial [marine sediment metagenome]
ITKDSKKFINENEGPWYHEMQELGFNYRLTDIQCALGISQLNRISKFIEKRREIAEKYDKAFENNQNIENLKENQNQFNPYHLYVIKVKNKETRLKLFKHLQQKDIFCQVHYIPVYWHPYYQRLGYKKGICLKAEKFYERIISLPMYPTLKKEEQELIIREISRWIK